MCFICMTIIKNVSSSTTHKKTPSLRIFFRCTINKSIFSKKKVLNIKLYTKSNGIQIDMKYKYKEYQSMKLGAYS